MLATWPTILPEFKFWTDRGQDLSPAFHRGQEEPREAAKCAHVSAREANYIRHRQPCYLLPRVVFQLVYRVYATSDEVWSYKRKEQQA